MNTVATVEVWTIALSDRDRSAAEEEAECQRSFAVLDDGERTRAARFSQQADRRRFVRAHGATREILARYLGEAPEMVRWRRGGHGKPLAVGPQRLEWNLSHSGELAIVAVLRCGAMESRADVAGSDVLGSSKLSVGVDIQSDVFSFAAEPFARRYLSEAEIAWEPERSLVERIACIFARKEACAKAVGGRLLDLLTLDTPMSQGLVTAASGPWAGQSWQLSDLSVPQGYAGAVAVSAARPFTVRHCVWHREGQQ